MPSIKQLSVELFIEKLWDECLKHYLACDVAVHQQHLD